MNEENYFADSLSTEYPEQLSKLLERDSRRYPRDFSYDGGNGQ